MGDSVCFNQRLSSSIFFYGVLEIFFQQVEIWLISQHPFLLHIRPILFFFFNPLINRLDPAGLSDLLTSYSIYSCFDNYFLRSCRNCTKFVLNSFIFSLSEPFHVEISLVVEAFSVSFNILPR